MDFELSEKFRRIDFEIEQALKDVGYHRRRLSEENIQLYSNRDQSRKNTLHLDSSDIWTDKNRVSGNTNGCENRPCNCHNYSSMERYCNTCTSTSRIPRNGKDVTHNEPAYCRKLITDYTSVLITNAATKTCALVGGGQNLSTPNFTPVFVDGQKRPRSPFMSGSRKLSKIHSFSPHNNDSNEYKTTELSPRDRWDKPASPRTNNALFVNLSRPKSPSPRLRTLKTEISPKGQDRPNSTSVFVTSSKGRPRSSSYNNTPHCRTVNESTSLETTATVLPRPRSSTLSPRLIQRKDNVHKYETKGTSMSVASPGRVCHSVVNRKYRTTSPIRHSMQHRRKCSLGTSFDFSPRNNSSCSVTRRPRSSSISTIPNRRQIFIPDISIGSNVASEDDTDDFENQESSKRTIPTIAVSEDDTSDSEYQNEIPTIVVTDWDTCTNQPLIYFDAGSKTNVDRVFKDSENMRRCNSVPGNLDGVTESEAHYQAMFLERRRSSCGDKLQLSSRIGLDIDNLVDW